ncbi:MAG TPA: ATP-binding protein [Streptosporangiaceae bacterium]|nr:ATP-binding protein [Streptosporangiaceae bacterium]
MTSAQARDLIYGGPGLGANDDLRQPHRLRQREMPLPGVTEPRDAVALPRELVLKPGPESVKAAREFTSATLRDWQLDDLVEEAVIVASELVTNAIRHGTRCTVPTEDDAIVALAWQRQAHRIVCIVTDSSDLPPVLEDADMTAESGRGLQVVHALTAAWGWAMLGACQKAVWAAFLLP